MITKFARLEFELFTKPSKSDFLRVHQSSTPEDFPKFFRLRFLLWAIRTLSIALELFPLGKWDDGEDG